jgi:hypothetical protein
MPRLEARNGRPGRPFEHRGVVAAERLSSRGHLDLPQGIAYQDDRAVGYLRVTRHANETPLLRGTSEDRT